MKFEHYATILIPGLTMRIVIISLILCLLPDMSFSQDAFKSKIYQSYIQGNISEWGKILDNTPEPRNDVEKLYDYALVHYGFIGYCVAAELKDPGMKYLEKAMEMSDHLLQMRPDDPRFFALQGALYGLHMGFDKSLAPILGVKALKTIKHALEIDPESPQALIEEGNKDWSAPKLMGGSKKDAISEYEKAIRLMENDKDFIVNNWYYLNTQINLAKYYEQLEMTNQTKRLCSKLLRIEPDLVWPREKLAALSIK